MNKTHPYIDGYVVNVFIDASGDYLAHFVDRPHVSASGKTEGEALAKLAEVWRLVKAYEG